MVNPLQQHLHKRTPAEAVVKSGVAKEQYGTGEVNGSCAFGHHSLGEHDQQNSSGNDKGKNAGVYPATPRRSRLILVEGTLELRERDV